MVISILKVEHVMSPYGRPPGSGVEPKDANVNNSVTKRHKLLKIDTRGIFITRNSMVISIFNVEHAITSYDQPRGTAVIKQYYTLAIIPFQRNLQKLQSLSILLRFKNFYIWQE